MKVCPTCGKQNKDTAKFCTGCGASILEVIAVPGEPAPEPAPAASSIYNAPAPAAAPAPAPAPARPAAPYVARTPAQERFKKLAGSKLAFVICIAFTLMLVFSIFNSAFFSDALTEVYMDSLDIAMDAGLGDRLKDAFDISSSDVYNAVQEAKNVLENSILNPANAASRLIGAVSGNAIRILFAVALWIIYGVAKKEESVCCGTAGLKIIRVLRTIGLVLAIILAVVIAVGIVFALFMTIREGYEDASLVLYILIGLTALVYVFMFCFLGGCISTVKRYISVSRNSSGRSRISGFVALLLFIGGILSAFSAIAWVGMGIATAPQLIAYAVTYIFTAIYQIALSLFIFRSKKALKTV